MSVLVITPHIRAKIEVLVAEAREHCIPWSVLSQIAIFPDKAEVTLADRKPGAPTRPPSQSMRVGDVEVAISFEEQPAGVCRHMSVAVETPGKLPGPEAVEALARAFGFTNFPPIEGRIWIEEYEPGRHAVNVVELAERAPQGTMQ